MRRILIGMLAALVAIVGAALPGVQTRAQGLVEYALILVVVPFASGESVEFLWYPQTERGRSDPPPLPRDRIVFQYRLFNSVPLSGQPCRQSVRASITFGDGINGMRAALGANGETLEVNGETVAVLDPCFVGASRLSLEIGIPVPPETVARLGGPGRVQTPRGLAPDVAAASVLKADGQTAAVISYWDEGLVLLDVSD
jgi:hypothetical protein